MLEQARLFLTDNVSPEIWEIKHIQNDLVNFTTRGNISLNTGENHSYQLPGVCAHNSAKSGFQPFPSKVSKSFEFIVIRKRTATCCVQNMIGLFSG
jgi:hypothetical protein